MSTTTRFSSRPLSARRFSCGLILIALVGACYDDKSEVEEEAQVGTAQQRVTGNIHPKAIQIDGPARGSPGADLYANTGAPLNGDASADWVADSLSNGGTSCLGADGIATCIEAGVTGARDGTGHWNGVRIVDGIASGDRDIFLTGGKENDTSSWNIGPGSVGSSKYDITQAYLANNQSTLYFGMERRGNNGTTAFDFEFNQLAPMTGDCPQDPLVPCRSAGDVLFVFEMQGSGGSGSADPYIFTWNGSAFEGGASSAIVSSINDFTATAGGPWGHVDSKGNWVLGNLDRVTFAEAAAPISVLPGIDACGGKAFVQVRTRSSVTDTSDLKDTTKVFEFQFLNLSAEASLKPSCDEGFDYSVTAVDADKQPIVGADCDWTFTDENDVSFQVLDDCNPGHVSAPAGRYTASVVVSDPALEGCHVTATTNEVAVYPVLGVTADLVATCESAFTYSASPSGGSPFGAFCEWHFGDGPVTVVPAGDKGGRGEVVVETPALEYWGTVECTDLRPDLDTCKASASDTAKPYAPLAVDLALLGQGATCPESDAILYEAQVTGGDGTYFYTWSDAACSGDRCPIDPADSTYCHEQDLFVTVDDGAEICNAAASETEHYSKVTRIEASDIP